MTVPHSIRVATGADAADATALLGSCYPVLMAGAYEPAVLAAALPPMTRANPALLGSGTWYLALDPAGRLVGCGGWTRERPGSGEVAAGLGHIRHFATDPASARLGIGRSLFAHAERAARAAGVTRFECYSSLNAEKFYAALGFVRIRADVIALRPGILFPAILMEHQIERG